jgi:uroporphyrinogen-III synthase
MVRTLEAETQARAPRLSVAGHLLELRGQAVLVDGALRPVAPAGMALLRALCRDPGRVVAHGPSCCAYSLAPAPMSTRSRPP